MKFVKRFVFALGAFSLLGALVCSAQNTRFVAGIARRQPSSQLSNFASNVVLGHNFDGIGQNSFGFVDSGIPPDPAGAVGPTQYIEWVNTELAVFDKGTGEIVSGPTAGNKIWAGMGEPCATNNDGQPVVQFDKLAGRWVLGQLALTGGPPYYFCVAVSQSADGTPGKYNLYSIQLSGLPDSPRLGVWPDAYYLTYNVYSGGVFQYAEVCGLDRVSMLNGQPQRGPLCTQTSAAYPSLLPADLDGNTPPPSGSPNFLLSLGRNALNFWTFHVDFSQGTYLLTGPTQIPVAPFNPICSIPNCIPQPGTSQHLTALSDRLMYRAAYRNFGDHESIVVNHTIVFAQRFASIRWYELRNPSAGPALYQQGTYNPTTIHRWMGNIAMDHGGDIVAAYNVSNQTVYPSLRFAARVPGDPLGVLGAENLAMEGTGSQTLGAAWGNSSSLSIDPNDDCTFWFTGEYQRGDGSPNWNTRISSFSLSSCPSSNPGIQITSAPQFGSPGSLQGTVSNIDPGSYSDYKVGVLLFISGLGWWSKPTCDELFVPITNGTWSAPVDSGGASDYTATRYVAYLLPKGAAGSCHDPGIDGLPFDLETQAIARAYYDRPNPQREDLTFAGLRWEVTDSQNIVIQPGGCVFSQANVFLDSDNNLHLRVAQVNGQWECAQIIPELYDPQYPPPPYGYGVYTFNLSTAVDGLDPNIVLGLYTWSDDPTYADAALSTSPWTNDPNGVYCPPTCPSHGELDVEFSKWGDPNNPYNAQFVVQPYNNLNARYQFTMPSGYTNSTAIISWLPDGVSFRVQDTNGNVLASYNYPGAVPQPADNGGWSGLFPSPQQVRLNLWLVNGNPPMNGQEVIVSGFSYTPF